MDWRIPPQWDGAMVKSFLRLYCGVSARTLTRLKKAENGILLNGRPAIATTRLQQGDFLEIHPPAGENHLPGLQVDVPVLWEDGEVIVFDKPPGMPVHPSPGHDCDSLANAAAAYAARRKERWAFRCVGRLDSGTSGAVIVAKNAHAAYCISKSIQKEYLALCEGTLTGEGVIDAPIRLQAGSKIRREVGAGGQEAVTQWRALEDLSCNSTVFTVVLLTLQTGRTHQIRVHMANAGHPLVGDDLYGGSTALLPRQALHCRQVGFFTPKGDKVTIHSPLPPDIAPLLAGGNRSTN